VAAPALPLPLTPATSHPSPFIVPQVLVEHLYREGRFEVADHLVEAAGLTGAGAIRERYTALHTILQQVGGRGRLQTGGEGGAQPRCAAQANG
jgi:hypothetical protein